MELRIRGDACTPGGESAWSLHPCTTAAGGTWGLRGVATCGSRGTDEDPHPGPERRRRRAEPRPGGHARRIVRRWIGARRGPGTDPGGAHGLAILIATLTAGPALSHPGHLARRSRRAWFTGSRGRPLVLQWLLGAVEARRGSAGMRRRTPREGRRGTRPRPGRRAHEDGVLFVRAWVAVGLCGGVKKKIFPPTWPEGLPPTLPPDWLWQPTAISNSPTRFACATGWTRCARRGCEADSRRSGDLLCRRAREERHSHGAEHLCGKARGSTCIMAVSWGWTPRLIAAAAARIEAVLDDAVPRGPTRPCLVVIGRGAPDPRRQRQRSPISPRMLATRAWASGWCEVGFSGVDIPAEWRPALEHVAKLGYRRVVVFPYFLFSGILIDRIYGLHRPRPAAAPIRGSSYRKAGYLGDHPQVLATFAERVTELVGRGGRRPMRDVQVPHAGPGFEPRWARCRRGATITMSRGGGEPPGSNVAESRSARSSHGAVPVAGSRTGRSTIPGHDHDHGHGSWIIHHDHDH